MREIKITGLEYKKRLEMVTIEVTHFIEVKCSISSDLTKRIWSKIICEKCYSGMEYPLIKIGAKGY